jgi:hypothetical protein
MLLWISAGYQFVPRITRRSKPAMPQRTRSPRHDPREPKAKQNMPVPQDVAGTAALAICESLLLALNDRNILPEREIVGILRDAAAAHEFAPEDEKSDLHGAVAALINGILAGGNSVRRR